MNPAAERIFGMTLEEMREEDLDHPHPKLMQEDGSFFKEGMTPCALPFHTGEAIHNVVVGIFNPTEKTHRWILVDAVPQFEVGKTRPTQVFTRFTDITESKKTKRK